MNQFDLNNPQDIGKPLGADLSLYESRLPAVKAAVESSAFRALSDEYSNERRAKHLMPPYPQDKMHLLLSVFFQNGGLAIDADTRKVLEGFLLKHRYSYATYAIVSGMGVLAYYVDLPTLYRTRKQKLDLDTLLNTEGIKSEFVDGINIQSFTAWDRLQDFIS